VAGTFHRADGETISIVRHHVDGIIAADPVSIQFRLPDGAEVARTPHIFDAAVRSVSSGVEIYQFRTTWLPIASRIDLFDGYQLRDITSSRRASSLLVHFTVHWIRYLVAGGLAAILVALHSRLLSIPKRGWRAALRALGLGLNGLAGCLIGYEILVFEPLSPLVLSGCAAVIWSLIRGFRQNRHATLG